MVIMLLRRFSWQAVSVRMPSGCYSLSRFDKQRRSPLPHGKPSICVIGVNAGHQRIPHARRLLLPISIAARFVLTEASDGSLTADEEMWVVQPVSGAATFEQEELKTSIFVS